MQELVEKIRSEIQSRGPIPFRDFMQRALYCPIYGYYEKEEDIIGRSGDFYTSVSAGPLFGQLLAYQFAEWLDCLEINPVVHPVNKSSGASPAPPLDERAGRRPLNQIAEAGAHDGTLAKDILIWLQQHRPALFKNLEYLIIEPSPVRRSRQQQTLAAFGDKVRWLEGFARADHAPVLHNASEGGTRNTQHAIRNTPHPSLSQPSTLNPQLFSGLIFSNELLDAMPVHRLGWDAKSHSWFEWGVTWKNDRFIWIRLANLTPGIRTFVPALPDELLEVLPDGFILEVPADACEWWRQAAGCLTEGKLIAIDYGLESEELLRPERSQGTLRAYRRHQLIPDVLSDPGEQDITAHVNFSMLKEAGEACGLTSEPIQTQAHFFTAIFTKASSSARDVAGWTEQQTRQFQTLTHPEHLGRAFRVLIQTRTERPGTYMSYKVISLHR